MYGDVWGMNNLQKTKRLESKIYRDWVCTLDCVICGAPGYAEDQIVAHHMKGVGYLSGVSLRAGDEWSIPMHVTCHTEWHQAQITELTMQWEWVARTQARAIAAILAGDLVLKDFDKLRRVLARQVGDTRACPHCQKGFVPDDQTSKDAFDIYCELFIPGHQS
jgi:hypothetical protein